MKTLKKGKYIYIIALICIITMAFLVRVVPQMDNIFREDVYFRGVDSYYHMRLADNMSVNFPNYLNYDYFAAYPDGRPVGYAPLMSWLIILFSFGIINIDYVGAFLPPVLASLTVISIFYLSKELFNTSVAFIAAILVALLPSEFLHRSLLGFTDHHVIEVLLTVTTLLFMSMAAIRKHYKYGILAGIFLGLFHLAWYGSVFLTLILILWYVIVHLYNYFKNDIIDVRLLQNTMICFGLSLLISLVYLPHSLNPVMSASVMVLSLVVPPVMYVLTTIKKKPVVFGILFVLLCVGIAIPSFVQAVSWQALQHQLFSVFWGGNTVIQEARTPDIPTLWFYYGITSLLALFGIAVYRINRYSMLLYVWSIMFIIASIGQRRWSYYAVVAIAILAAYALWWLVNHLHVSTQKYALMFGCFFIAMVSLPNTLALVKSNTDMNADWYNACMWLRNNTPEYSIDYDALETGKADYGVLSWWDYGHFIIRIGHRCPASSPTWQDVYEQEALAATTPEEVERILGGSNIKYIMIDETMVNGKFYAIWTAATGSVEGWHEALPYTFAFNLYYNQVDGYRLVHQEYSVKVFERL